MRLPDGRWRGSWSGSKRAGVAEEGREPGGGRGQAAVGAPGESDQGSTQAAASGTPVVPDAPTTCSGRMASPTAAPASPRGRQVGAFEGDVASVSCARLAAASSSRTRKPIPRGTVTKSFPATSSRRSHRRPREPVPGRDTDTSRCRCSGSPGCGPAEDSGAGVQRQLGQARGEVPRHARSPAPGAARPGRAARRRGSRAGCAGAKTRWRLNSQERRPGRCRCPGRAARPGRPQELVIPAGDIACRRPGRLAVRVRVHALSVPFKQTGAELVLGPHPGAAATGQLAPPQRGHGVGDLFRLRPEATGRGSADLPRRKYTKSVCSRSKPECI